MIETAVITGAGKGTRLRPATTVVPKVLLPLVNAPVIQLAVEEALDAGITKIALIIGTDGDLIRRHFAETEGPWQGRIAYVLQREPRGVGDAIRCAREFVGGKPFALLFGDSVFPAGNPTRTLQRDFDRHGEALIAVQQIRPEDTPKRGVVDIESSDGRRHRLRGMAEKPSPESAPSRLAGIARYVLTPAIFDCIDAAPLDCKGELNITEPIVRLMEQEPVTALEIDDTRLDIGNPKDYAAATLFFARKRLGLSL